MKKTVLWALALLAGFGLMLLSDLVLRGVEPGVPWAYGVMWIGDYKTDPGGMDRPVVAARVRFLPDAFSRAFLDAIHAKGGKPRTASLSLPANAVALTSGSGPVLSERMLGSGRLPEAGTEEAVAGFLTSCRESISIGDKTFRIVGVLKPEVVTFSHSYVLRRLAGDDSLFALSAAQVRAVHLVQLSAEEAASKETWRRTLKAMTLPAGATALPATYSPPMRFGASPQAVRVRPGPYWVYLAGMALLLLGGTGLLLRLYHVLASLRLPGVVRSPLLAIRRWRRLVWGLHLGCFGLLIAMAAAAYPLPQVQGILLELVGREIAGGEGPLGAAGRAYASGNILRAAAVTFAVNFLLATLLTTTAPSIVIPGIGALVVLLRAAAVGLILAPTFAGLSRQMLPHSITLLVELHAYVLAGFFALLIPIYIFQKRRGPSAGRRYGRATLLNLKACLLIAAILAVAALYEAIEVIAMMD